MRRLYNLRVIISCVYRLIEYFYQISNYLLSRTTFIKLIYHLLGLIVLYRRRRGFRQCRYLIIFVSSN